MSKRKGTVSGVGKGKFSFFVQLDDDGFYFNTKFEPKCGIGDVVGIEFDKKADNRGNVKNIKVLEDSGSPKGVQERASSGGGGTGNYTADPNRQASIVFQSSRKDALVFITTLLAAEAFAVKGKADAKRVQLEELLDEITVKFFNDAMNPKDSDAFKNAGEIEEDAKEDEGETKSDEKSDEWNDEWED